MHMLRTQVVSTLTGAAALLGGLGLVFWGNYELKRTKNLSAMTEPLPGATLLTDGPFE